MRSFVAISGFFALLAGCQFNPRSPAPKLEIGEICALDPDCTTGLCETSCVECRASAPCVGGDVCVNGTCVPPVVDSDPPSAVIGGHVQTDDRGRRHRGRVAVPAVTSHRKTIAGGS